MDDAQHPTEAAPDPLLAVEGLAASRGSVRAVRDVSLTVEAGQVHALLGPNGAGKTTTLDVVLGFCAADAGTVRVLGHDPATATGRRAIRREIGMVPQEGGHYPYLSVRETLEMHRGLRDRPRPLGEMLELAGLAHRAGRRVRSLSGGERRRLDLAVALAGYPRLLVLDEPTTGFDPAAREAMWEVIRGLAADGRGVLLTTHYLEEAQQLSGSVTVVAAGATVASGSSDGIARRLGLRSRIVLELPPDAPRLPPDLGPDVEADLEVAGDGHRLEALAADPAPLLAVLAAWSRSVGHPLDGLEVRPPSLEDSYRVLTATKDGER